jgi:hypothetical protein
MDGSKKRRLLGLPTPAMIVAFVALFVALGGTSYAAATLAANSVGTKQIKSSAVTAAKIKDKAVTAKKVGALPGARVRLTAATTVNHNSTAVLTYDAVDFNVGGVYAAASPTRLTAHATGRYLIMASARWGANSSGRRTIALVVTHNGAQRQIARTNESAYATTVLALEQTAQAVFPLKAGDYVEVWAYQDSGGPLPLLTNVEDGVTFTLEWLAP